MNDANTLKLKLDDWKRRLSEPDVHSINAQIGHMLWRSAFYRSINESRKYLPDGEEGRKRANGPLHELVDEGYFLMTATAIRRLLDTYPASGPRGVYSLYGLLKDIEADVPLLTRANVLAARGLEYDYEPIKQRAREEAWADAKARPGRGTFVSRKGWADSEYWHGVMDRLCGVAAANRRPTDVPERQRFRQLLEELAERGRSVRDWVDKFAAHAASPDSRGTVDPDHHSLSLAKLWRAELAIVRAANFVSYHVVEGVNVYGVPVAEFDQFQHLEEPFAQWSAREAMQRAWDKHSQAVSESRSWFWDRPLVEASEYADGDEVEGQDDAPRAQDDQ